MVFTVKNDGCTTSFDHDVRIYNNIISGLETGERAVTISETWPGTLEMDYNVYESVDNWANNGTEYNTLADWRTAIGDEANSDTCAPTFLASRDFHLDTTDTCAQDTGTSLAADFTDDFDGTERPQNVVWDIGMGEYASGYTAPDGACCTGESCSITIEASCDGGVWQGAATICSPNPCSVVDPPSGVPFSDGVSLVGVKKD